MPLSFLVAAIVALASPEPEAERGYAEVARRALIGEG